MEMITDATKQHFIITVHACGQQQQFIMNIIIIATHNVDNNSSSS